MKTTKFLFLLIIVTLFFAQSCKQNELELTPSPAPPTVTTSSGSIDFSKYVAIGNSLSAGFQSGALFTEGQTNSFPAILSKQFSLAHDSTLAFNQPDINSVNGYSGVSNGTVLGRLVLYTSTDKPSDALPVATNTPGIDFPDEKYKSADIPSTFSGSKTDLNNFGVPGIKLGQLLEPKTGGPNSNDNPYFNLYYDRFATNPGTSTILEDVLATKPTFITFELGANDVLGYATNGGDESIDSLTSNDVFYDQFLKSITDIMLSSETIKVAVSTIPEVVTIPYFKLLAWNSISLSETHAKLLNSQLEIIKYSSFLDAMVSQNIISDEEASIRGMNFKWKAGNNNPILISDESLTDLSPYMTGELAYLKPYALARPATSKDLVIALSTSQILGKTPPGGSLTDFYGVTIPLEDKHILTEKEIEKAAMSTKSFNSTINKIAEMYPERIVVADLHSSFNKFASEMSHVANNVTITPSIVPPNGGFSEDGVHPNSRGYAFIANIFINALNEKFGATIPKANLADYKANDSPISGQK